MKTNGIDFSASYPIDNIYKTQTQSQKLENFEAVLKKASEEKDDKALKEACQEFEAYFINQLFKEMRRTIQPGGLIEKVKEKKYFKRCLMKSMPKVLQNQMALG